ncbi:glycosyltransferase family 2 protein [soil metagenome]
MSFQTGAADRSRNPGVSIVIAVKDEEKAIGLLVKEIVAALGSDPSYEIIVIDDGSTDRTVETLMRLRAAEPRLSILQHRRNHGQSAAVRTGVRAALSDLIVTLDGDGQNDPADIPLLLQTYRRLSQGSAVRLVTGRRARRQDSLIKRLSSTFANSVRGWVLRDGSLDSACGLKVIDREVFLRLPYFNHMHRFLPALVRREGFEVAAVDVNHRPRETGASKYGTWDRLTAGVIDLAGVAWLQTRRASPEIVDL